MKVEIWSDIMCPFCYMGKRLFENALKEFTHHDQVEIEWKSFLLSPEQVTDTQTSLTDHLVKVKGMSRENVEQMTGNIVERARSLGLDFQFDKVVVANTIKAHKFIKFAQTHGLGSEAYELVFQAYFIHGLNVDDNQTLLELGGKLGIPALELKKALEDEAPKLKVFNDYQEAQSLGITGVPFFVFDRKLAVSGAQDQSTFLEALKQSWG